jgi:hypothetical protein
MDILRKQRCWTAQALAAEMGQPTIVAPILDKAAMCVGLL